MYVTLPFSRIERGLQISVYVWYVNRDENYFGARLIIAIFSIFVFNSFQKDEKFGLMKSETQCKFWIFIF